MKTRRLIVTRPHRYGTRHLTAGEEYEVPPRHAVALVAAKRARFADGGPYSEKPRKVKPAPVAAVPPDAAGIEELQAEAMRLGIVVDGRWGAPRLRYQIAQAKR